MRKDCPETKGSQMSCGERILQSVAEEVEAYQHCWSTGGGLVGLTSIKSKLCNLQKDPFLRGADCD